MSSNPTAAAGQLSVWTDVDPAHELDFNRWYDREHMQERMAIPGFRRARRFRALVSCPRPYLALYDTDTLEVFRSPAYRKAFTQQSEWSLRNFARMRETQRRVGELVVDVGDAEGGALALFVLRAGGWQPGTMAAHFRAAAERDHVVRASLLRTDVGLSTPLAAGAPPAAADAVAMVEASSADAAFEAAKALAGQMPTEASGDVVVFQLMSRFGG
jgi:hypothetical protein